MTLSVACIEEKCINLINYYSESDEFLVEESFDIMMETDDIIDFSSFKKGIEILKKYDVDIEVEENVVEE